MMKKIFYTNVRGSGKTKWLVDQYVKERCAGNYCIYLGGERKRRHFVEEVSNRGLSYSAGLPENDGYRRLVLCFFTDDFECEIGMENLCLDLDRYHFVNARWYITLDNGCFDKESKL